MTVHASNADAAHLAAQQAGDVFSRKASGLTRVVSPWTALAYSFVAPNITQASFYLLWSVTLFAGANMPYAILFMLSLLPFAAIYVYFSASMPRSGGEYIYISRVLTPFLGFLASWTLTIVGLNWQGNNTNYVQYNFGTVANPASGTFDARFYFNPHGNTGSNQTIFAASSTTSFSSNLFSLRYRWNGGSPQVQIQVGSTANAAWVNITNASHYVELVWQSGSGNRWRN